MPQAKRPIIGEIEAALRSGAPDKRIKILMNVTDLFVAGAADYGELDVALFDDVFGQLFAHVESAALAELSARLAPLPNAPAATVGALARRDAAAIAGPVLAQSARLSDGDLIEIARSKSQAHLAHIARRPRINEPVTEALVEHGDAEVASEVAGNAGARLSNLTMAKLVMRADGDERLTDVISQRGDIPPALLRRLMLQATAAVRAKLLAAAKPDQKATISRVLNEISALAAAPAPRDFAQAQRIVSVFSQDTELTRARILEFADTERIAEMIAALSVLSDVPPEHIDRLVHAADPFGLMVLCRSVDLMWNTAHAVIMARPQAQPVEGDLREQFKQLSVQSAQKLVHFWVGRQMVVRKFPQAAAK